MHVLANEFIGNYDFMTSGIKWHTEHELLLSGE